MKKKSNKSIRNYFDFSVNKMGNLTEQDLGTLSERYSIQWLEKNLWGDVVSGKPLNNLGDIHIHQNIFACNKHSVSMKGNIWAEEEKPRLYTDRASNLAVDGLIFHFARIYYARNCGLYFLVRFRNNDDHQAPFESALKLLGDSGIGSDRNTGNGLFEWCEDANFSIPSLPDSPSVCLSQFNPCLHESDSNLCSQKSTCKILDCQMDWLENSSYNIMTTAGWMGASGDRSATLRMFSEGSCFPKKLKGRMVCVGQSREGFNVYRDGRGFFL